MCLMSITAPSKNELASAIEASTFQAFSDLFADHKENFYYCTLITTGEGLPPALAAWSWEALNREILKDPQLEVLWIKWSWADSPYLDYGNQYFDTVNSLFSLRPQILDLKSSLDRSDELRFRLEAMEKAMQNLDRRGLFGHGEDRKKIVINAESVPPDHTNTETALRLNPIEALDDWLKENSEPRP